MDWNPTVILEFVLSVVTPCMGVWIETFIASTSRTDGPSHPVWVCGLKPTACAASRPPRQSHPVWVCGLKLIIYHFIFCFDGHTLYGCVDWNLSLLALFLSLYSHTLYGCVDWNLPALRRVTVWRVTPCMGVWIETGIGWSRRAESKVTPCMGVWIETCLMLLFRHLRRRHTLYGCVDWNSG